MVTKKLMTTQYIIEVKGHQRSNVVCALANTLGQKNLKCKLMTTFMKVKGHQMSSGVIFMLWPPNIWSEELMIQVYDDGDLHGD